MPGLGKKRPSDIEDVEIDLVPIMNMFLVLVPFLLMSAAFIQLKAIDTSTPILAKAGKQEAKPAVTVIMEIGEKGLHLSAISDTLDQKELNKWDIQINKEKQNKYPLTQALVCLQKIKNSYPASDTLMIIPAGTILYDTIIQAMDIARYFENKPLFPNMVLSGKVG